jgi:[lysine-biosynthesis-protein LysW]--L-2-aminoadipate ligase
MTELLIAGRLTPTNVALHDACRAYGVGSRILPLDLATRRARLDDVVLGRVDVLPSLDGIEAGLLDLQRLDELGLRVLNTPRAISIAHDKLETAQALAAAGVPHPSTVHVRDGRGASIPFEPPYVVKPRFGSWGKDVVRAETTRELKRALGKLRSRPWFAKHGALVQQLVPNDGVDLRLVVAGGEVIGAINRVAAPGEWRTNVALGGTRVPTVPPREARRLALAAAAAVGGDLVGIDLLDTRDSFTVLEVNGCVDFTQDYSLGPTDIFDEAVASLLECAQARPNATVRALDARKETIQ